MTVTIGEIRRYIQSGAIRLGMARLELFWLLGTPDDVGGTSRKYPLPCVFKYGEVEFAFTPSRNRYENESATLTLVFIDDAHRDEPEFLLQENSRY